MSSAVLGAEPTHQETAAGSKLRSTYDSTVVTCILSAAYDTVPISRSFLCPGLCRRIAGILGHSLSVANVGRINTFHACKHVFAAPEATHAEDDHLMIIGKRRVQTISLLDEVRCVLRRRVRNRRVTPGRALLRG